MLAITNRNLPHGKTLQNYQEVKVPYDLNATDAARAARPECKDGIEVKEQAFLLYKTQGTNRLEASICYSLRDVR